MGAPQCRIAPPPPTFDSNAPQLPSIPIVSINPQNWNIPQAVMAELQQLAFAFNTMRQAFNTAVGANVGENNLGEGHIGAGGGGGVAGGGAGGGSPAGKKQQSKTGGRFKEVNRTTKKVKIVNPDDTSQYVTIKQITSLTFRDHATGETWYWTQGQPGLNVDSSS